MTHVSPRKQPASRRRTARLARALALGATVGSASLGAPSAHAEAFDLRGFVDKDDSGYTLDEPALVDVLSALVANLRPAYGSTGATTGARGMSLSVGLALTPIDADSASWQRATTDEDLESLEAFVVQARKGLPSGFELEASVAHNASVELTAASFGLRWAWLEGEPGLPDLGLRLDGGAIVGHPQVTLATAGLELILGYPVPIAGLLRLAPYTGYSFRYARSIERRVALVDGVSVDPFVTVLPPENVFLSHAIVGLRIQSSALDIGVEAMLGSTTGVTFQLGARL